MKIKRQGSRLLKIFCALIFLTAPRVCQGQDCREFVKRIPFTPAAKTFAILYAVKPDGSVWWWRDEIGTAPGPGTDFRVGGVNCRFAERVSHSLSEPRHVNDRWARENSVADVVPGGDRTIYVVRTNGDLDWFLHEGFFDGGAQWQGPTVVGTGWGSGRVVGMGRGLLYAQMDGDLVWYRHETYQTGGNSNANWTQPAVNVSSFFQPYQPLFAGGRGVFYGVNAKGQLVWFRHKTYLGPTVKRGPAALEDWDGGRAIGGWVNWKSFTKLFCADKGRIYGLLPSGELRAYDHFGWATGLDSWGEEVSLGDGWGDYEFLIAQIRF
jgi:hypothetical protein